MSILRHDADTHLSYVRKAGQNVASPWNEEARVVVWLRVNSATAPEATVTLTPGFRQIKGIHLLRVVTPDGAPGTRGIRILTQAGESLFPFNRVGLDNPPGNDTPVYPLNTDINVPLVHYKDANGHLEGRLTVEQSDFDGADVADSKVAIMLLLELASWQ